MKRKLLLAVLLAACLGCTPKPTVDTYLDEVSADASLILLSDSLSPNPAPVEPVSALPTGPIDTIKQASALIKKGNELADRGKAILDNAERDGKVTVDIRLPPARVSSDCGPNGCPVGVIPRTESPPALAPVYQEQPRLLPRLRRWR